MYTIRRIQGGNVPGRQRLAKVLTNIDGRIFLKAVKLDVPRGWQHSFN